MPFWYVSHGCVLPDFLLFPTEFRPFPDLAKFRPLPEVCRIFSHLRSGLIFAVSWCCRPTPSYGPFPIEFRFSPYPVRADPVSTYVHFCPTPSYALTDLTTYFRSRSVAVGCGLSLLTCRFRPILSTVCSPDFVRILIFRFIFDPCGRPFHGYRNVGPNHRPPVPVPSWIFRPISFPSQWFHSQ